MTHSAMKLTDQRIESSHGGGYLPEQHAGVLKNGIPFYFRMRHNQATLVIGPVGISSNILPLRNPEYVAPDFTAEQREQVKAEHGATDEQINQAITMEQIAAAFDPYSGYFWGPVGVVTPYEVDEDQGSFYEDNETRQRTFTECLDQIEALGYGDAFTVDVSIFEEGL